MLCFGCCYHSDTEAGRCRKRVCVYIECCVWCWLRVLARHLIFLWCAVPWESLESLSHLLSPSASVCAPTCVPVCVPLTPHYQQVIHRANDNAYGLAACVFSRNMDEINTLTRAIRAGAFLLQGNTVSQCNDKNSKHLSLTGAAKVVVSRCVYAFEADCRCCCYCFVLRNGSWVVCFPPTQTYPYTPCGSPGQRRGLT